MDRTVAAIDIGTNSIHMMVARMLDDGSFRTLTREKEAIRLGCGGGDMKSLGADAIDRGIKCLARFGSIAAQWDAEVHAYATSAVREASNRAHFIDRVAAETGIHVEVISGAEEARLIHLGVLQAVAVDQRHLVVDIGGGSTEFIVADGTTPLLLRSVKLGAIRLTDRFFPGGVSTVETVAECRVFLRSYLAPLRAEVASLGPIVAIASSGTAQTLALMAGNPERLSATNLTNLTTTLITSTLEQRAAMPGLDAKRFDIIVGGAVLFDEITTCMGVDEWVISDLALRTGIVLDLAQRHSGDSALHHLSDLRRESALSVARRYEEDVDHAEHITDLALELFDELEDWHMLGLVERDLLEAAGLLHNIGVFVSHSAHHKHSYYLIRNTEQLAGFTERERELIAQVARYHRKSAPAPKHPEFAGLSGADRDVVTTLASILRIAIGLDRSDRTVVTALRAQLTETYLLIEALVTPDADTSLELYSAKSRSSLLAFLVGRPVEIVAVPTSTVPPSKAGHPASQASTN